ncbi:MerR family transcriptional regulator [Saccharopolyspora sp. K220]|uniref:MerR family transcriptional regulator n=1 Tax=Saccharopolyspora soli TaxID=2926618 RepID=UPI001F5A52F7|nr:MerR family transcriptional regulator [Saccharopolyspora soli]MCI2419087.1 MerR family transcriptional regulator [Saccharopolyspora soli]
MDLLQVGEAAEHCGVSANALRYYERVGLLEPVERDAGGRRRYDEQTIAQAVFVIRMRQTGMTIRTLREYLDLMRAGEHTIDRRREILLDHQARLLRQRTAIDACLGLMANKLDAFGQLAAAEGKR